MIPPEADLQKDKVLEILDKVKPTFEKEPSLIKIKTKKAVFVGDTHGDSESSKYVFDNFDPNQYTLIFLGDYVDRGPQQLKNVTFLFHKKLEIPDKVILLRGNHETQEVNRVYGFLNELLLSYNEEEAYVIWNKFNEVFSFLPYGCLVNRRLLAIHGGIPSRLTLLKQIELLSKGESNPKDPVAFQLLWNDPSEEVKSFRYSDRGEGIMLFGEKAVETFEKKNGISLIIRSHEPVPEGAKYLFSASLVDKRNKMGWLKRLFMKRANRYPGLLLTVFTCRYYTKCRPAVAVLEDTKIRKVEIPVSWE
ncbi:MAG: metallophosphoesterase [Thermoproteota archaeon]